MQSCLRCLFNSFPETSVFFYQHHDQTQFEQSDSVSSTTEPGIRSGLETAASLYGLITSSISVIEASIKIYNAVQDKSGITEELRKVSDRLPTIQALLRDAAAQYQEKRLKDQQWLAVRDTIRDCEETCRELQEVLDRAYPTIDAGRVSRVFKNLGNIISQKGKTAQQLLQEIYKDLQILSHHHIITETKLLEEIKETVDELFPVSGITQNNIYGTNVAGDQNFNNSGSGYQFNGPGVQFSIHQSKSE